MYNEKCISPSIHYGRNIKRIREILGVKQVALAVEFNITQQAVSDMEKKAFISNEILERVSQVLRIPVEVIKNFNDEASVDVITKMFNYLADKK